MSLQHFDQICLCRTLIKSSKLKNLIKVLQKGIQFPRIYLVYIVVNSTHQDYILIVNRYNIFVNDRIYNLLL